MAVQRKAPAAGPKDEQAIADRLLEVLPGVEGYDLRVFECSYGNDLGERVARGAPAAGAAAPGAAGAVATALPQAQHDAPPLEAGEARVAFGKHRGRTFAEVLRGDPAYCDWVLRLERPYGAMAAFSRFLRQAAAPASPQAAGLAADACAPDRVPDRRRPATPQAAGLAAGACAPDRVPDRRRPATPQAAEAQRPRKQPRFMDIRSFIRMVPVAVE